MQHRLPNGAFTTSDARYAREWGAIAKRLERKYPVVVIGYDPWFLLQPKDGGNGFDIPTWFAIEITKDRHD